MWTLWKQDAYVIKYGPLTSLWCHAGAYWDHVGIARLDAFLLFISSAYSCSGFCCGDTICTPPTCCNWASLRIANFVHGYTVCLYVCWAGGYGLEESVSWQAVSTSVVKCYYVMNSKQHNKSRRCFMVWCHQAEWWCKQRSNEDEYVVHHIHVYM